MSSVGPLGPVGPMGGVGGPVVRVSSSTPVIHQRDGSLTLVVSSPNVSVAPPTNPSLSGLSALSGGKRVVVGVNHGVKPPPPSPSSSLPPKKDGVAPVPSPLPGKPPTSKDKEKEVTLQAGTTTFFTDKLCV